MISLTRAPLSHRRSCPRHGTNAGHILETAVNRQENSTQHLGLSLRTCPYEWGRARATYVAEATCKPGGQQRRSQKAHHEAERCWAEAKWLMAPRVYIQ